MKKETEEKRRQRGTGSIFRKPPNKNWFVQFYKKGKRIREGTGSPDYDNAKKLLRQRMHEIDQNYYIRRQDRGRPARVRDLYDALKLFRDTKKKGRARELPNRWAHLEPVFGTMLAVEVESDDVVRYTLARQKAGAADATINRELAALKRMFRFGLRSKKVKTVPYIEMLEENNTRTGFVEDAEYARLTANATELWLRTLLELGYSYGWRRGELLELRVRQVNFPNRTLRLDPGTTKNKEGREVAMTGKVHDLLREAVKGKHSDDYVLTRNGGAPVRDFRNAWHGLCVRAGLARFTCKKCGGDAEPIPAKAKRLRGQHGALYQCPKCLTTKLRAFQYVGLIPHDLRRSAAKAARRAGVPESVVMKMGGWKTAAMFRRYAIDSGSDQRAAAEMVERARAAALAPETAPFGIGASATTNGVKPN